MFVGALGSAASGVVLSFDYRGLGRGEKLPPDRGDMGWSWNRTLDSGVDIDVSISRRCFVDRARVEFSAAGAVRACEILSGGALLGAYRGEGGRPITEAIITVAVCAELDFLTVRLYGSVADISISALTFFGATIDEATLYPTPAECELGGAVARVAGARVAAEGGKDAAFCAEHLRALLSERAEGEKGEGQYDIRLAIDESLANEAYEIRADVSGAHLIASCRRALLYACEAFASLASDGNIRACRLRDAPRKTFRGAHLYLPARGEIGFFKRLVRFLLLPMRYNAIILEFAGGMEYESHPEITRAWLDINERAGDFPHGGVAGGGALTHGEVREIVAYAREYGFEVIPEVQSFGHVQYITRAHPEIAERAEGAGIKVDERGEDQPPDVKYPHTYCPSNPESYRIIFDLLDEIIDVVRPTTFVHMGHDEVYQLGLCPLCRDTPHAELYARHVNAMYEHLKERGLRMMIWSDMLQPCSRYQTPPAIKLIPRDIVLMDFIWYFHPELDIEDALLEAGFEVVIGNLYSSHYPRYASRAEKRGVLGGEISMWVETSESALAENGKLFDMLYTAQLLWSRENADELRGVFTRMICALLPRLREKLRGAAYPSLHAHAERALAFSAARALPNGLVALEEGGEIAVGGLCDSIRFTQAALFPEPHEAFKPLPILGAYEIVYENGETASLEVKYGSVARCDRPYAFPLPHMYYRHVGYEGAYLADPAPIATADGGQVTCYALEWLNPRPDVPVRSVRFAQRPGRVELYVLSAAALKLE